jgi:hypothetical protein
MKKIALLAFTLFFIATACKKDEKDPDLTLDKTSFDLTYHETNQIKANVACTWSSADSTVATVTNGLVVAVKIGETNIIAKTASGQLATCKVKVFPRFELYDEPFFKYGASASYVKSNEMRDLEIEETNTLLYLGENNNILGMVYVFDDGKLFAADALLNSIVGFNSVKEFIEERYSFVEKVDGYPVYVDQDENYIYVNIDPDLELNVLYFSYSKKNSSHTYLKDLISHVKKSVIMQKH